jgi:lipid-A-disaccharide synthase
MDDLAVMGFAELIPRLPALAARLREAAAAVRAARPDVLLTVDAKAFAFRLIRRVVAARERDEGPRGGGASPSPSRKKPTLVAQYVAPSFWAWRGGERRLARLERAGVDLVLCLLPNEPEAIRRAGVDAAFVGHPAAEDAATYPPYATMRPDAASATSVRFRARRTESDAANPNRPKTLALFPGSRANEIKRHLPLFRAACEQMVAEAERAREREHERPLSPSPSPSPPFLVAFVTPGGPGTYAYDAATREAASWPVPASVLPVGGGDARARRDAFAGLDAAVACAGTASAQLFANRVPHVTVYAAAHPATEFLLRRMLLGWEERGSGSGSGSRGGFFAGTPNVVFGEAVAPELLGAAEATPEAIAREAGRVLFDARAREAQTRRGDAFVRMLEPPTGGARAGRIPGEAAARAIMDALERKREGGGATIASTSSGSSVETYVAYR